MATRTNEPRQERDSNFGLPQAEFKPIEREETNWLRIIAIMIGVVLAIGTGMVYWFFYHSSSTDHQIDEGVEAYEQKDIDFIDDDAAEPPPLEEKLEIEPPVPTKPQKGTITKVNTPQDIHYVVAGSFIDSDLAMDHAERLAKQGINVTIIEPKEGEFFFRVAIEQKKIFHEAYDQLRELKATHGSQLWILKY
ncbi:MAG: hypothetical protein ROO73_06165 [Roseivirga sp.]